MLGVIGAAFASALASNVVGSMFGSGQQQQQPGFQAPEFKNDSWKRLMERLYGLGGTSGMTQQPSLAGDPVLEAYRMTGRAYG